MRIAICIFRYFPHGGLQKDFLRVACECARRGHSVELFCGRNSELPQAPIEGIRWHTIPLRGMTNHVYAKSFERQLRRIVRAQKFDCVLGFNRMKGLDFYFAGDVCLAESLHRRIIWAFRKIIPRYRVFLRMEESVFSPKSATRILSLTEKQKDEYCRWYNTQETRFIPLPVGFDSRCGNVKNVSEVRERVRRELNIGDAFAVALVGSDFKRKGADRAIAAIAALPEERRQRVKFFMIGASDPKDFFVAATDAGIRNSVFYLGGRGDVPELMCGMDLLVHPAREEAGGSVLIEAVVSRLPVICTDICGFAPHVEEWNAGRSVASPFVQEKFNAEFADFVATLMQNRGACRIDLEKVNPQQYRRAAVVADQLEKFVGERAD